MTGKTSVIFVSYCLGKQRDLFQMAEHAIIFTNPRGLYDYLITGAVLLRR